ncbi:MAG: hypothetical protein ACJ72D_10240 [Marmoricola sp.]
MSDHQNDPLADLRGLTSGRIAVSPLPPADVRRLGERRRHRRRGALAGVVAATVVAVGIPVAVLSDHGNGSSAPPVAGTPTPSPTAGPKVITYPGSGVFVATPADADKLTGTSGEFKAFIADLARRDAESGAGCPDAAHGVTVQKYSSAGFASGASNDCGGGIQLWVRYNDAWGIAQSTQDGWDCDALTFLKVPGEFVDACTMESGDFGMPEAGGPVPGMTKAQLNALGLEIVPTPPGADPTSCPQVDYGTPVLPDGNAGLYDAQDGLVSVNQTTVMKTAEGVGLGTERSVVLGAYPKGHDDGSGDYIVPRDDGTNFIIRFGNDQRVASLTWYRTPKHCGAWLQ